MTVSDANEVRVLNRWPNRPGRDLLISLAILYVGYAALTLVRTGDLQGSLLAPFFFFALTVPAGIGYSLLIVSWLTPIAVAAPVVALGALVVRTPWFVRIPLVVLAAVAAGFVTVRMGVAIR